MTTITGIVDKDRVLIGCDSSYVKGIQQHTGPVKVFVPAPGWLIGVVGSYKVAQLIQYGVHIKFFSQHSNTIERLMMTYFPLRLLELLEKNKLTSIEEGSITYDGAIMIGIENQLFVIGSDFAVLPMEDFAAIGSGADYAYGAARSSRHLTPHTILKEALEAACHYDIYTTAPIKIQSTK